MTDTISLCKSMRQHYKGSRVFPENLCCSEPWVSAVLMELTWTKLLSSLGLSPPSQPAWTFWSGPSSNQLRKLSALWREKCFQGSDRGGCWSVPRAEGTEKLTKMGQRWELCLKWAESWYYWKGWTWHLFLIIGCESVIGEKLSSLLRHGQSVSQLMKIPATWVVKLTWDCQ